MKSVILSDGRKTTVHVAQVIGRGIYPLCGGCYTAGVSAEFVPGEPTCKTCARRATSRAVAGVSSGIEKQQP